MSSQEEEQTNYQSETDREVKDRGDNGEQNEGSDMDDLFGDDSDQESDEGPIVSKSSSKPTAFIDEDEDAGQIDEDEDDEEEEVEQREINAIDLDLPKHPVSNRSENDDIYFVSLPAFLNVDPFQFDGTKFKKSILESSHLSHEDRTMEKLFAENMIRWKYGTSGDKAFKQSNAHFVEWSDGSLSLKLGKEIFDIVRNSTSDHFLTIRHNALEIFQTDSIFGKNMKIIPSSTSSEIHKRLTNYIKAKNSRSDTVNQALLDVDPEEVLRQREKAEEEAIRNQRRLEQRKLMEEERMERSGRTSSRNTTSSYNYDYDDDEGSHVTGGRSRSGGYFDEDEDDDFVAEDDEEIASDDEEDELDRSERLNKLKESGKKKYDDDEDDEEDDEEAVRVTKKRRVIADDEDEDD
ncbi:Leo1 protein [Saccharomycopsis crataegensis]|uniref:Leo1 protein n=1 Tax=Saccharomycopsis crataegensis TaxID=43959 RepID=A0AAV5QTS1_9ASCO|nr:Leo1 protein [Saccharomycopsis crataegensis]